MKPLLRRGESRDVDAKAIALGVPGVLLMENAGRGAADVLCARMGECLRAPLVIGGVGQNGGDAWVVARQLRARGVAPRCVLIGDPASVGGDAAINLAALEGLGVRVHAVGEGGVEALAAQLAGASVIVDGLFGTGLSRPLEGIFAQAVATLASAGVPSLALDLPSGICADTGAVLGVALPAKITVTFAAHKRGLHQHPGVDYAGEVVVADIGVPPPLARTHLLEEADLSALLPRRAMDSHKGVAGHVLVLAGSPGRTGAALLSGLGAIRAGAGLVTIASRGARSAIDAKVIELMSAEIPEALEAGVAAALREAVGKASCVLGPGLGLDTVARALSLRLAVDLPLPVVLDADALTALAADPGALRNARAARVLTPHPGEAGRLLGSSSAPVQAGRYAAAEALCAKTGQVVVLKGARTIIAAPDGRLAVCPHGTPALGVAGTGDVLAGALGAALATLPPFEAACAAVLQHARAGELAAAALHEGADRGLLASEVAGQLPAALASARRLDR